MVSRVLEREREKRSETWIVSAGAKNQLLCQNLERMNRIFVSINLEKAKQVEVLCTLGLVLLYHRFWPVSCKLWTTVIHIITDNSPNLHIFQRDFPFKINENLFRTF